MPKSISGTTILVNEETSDGLIIAGTIASAPIPTTAGLFQVSAVMTDLSTGKKYVNTGTTAVPVWTESFGLQNARLVSVALTAADLIDTAAGKLSHANGLIVVPAAPTGFVNVLHRAIVSYTFATAAFTGGGNTTMNIGGGGAAITGLIATTTLWQNASSIIQEFVPLSTVAFPITKETSINLKTASAITNPGTAAGSAIVYVWYSQVAI